MNLKNFEEVKPSWRKASAVPTIEVSVRRIQFNGAALRALRELGFTRADVKISKKDKAIALVGNENGSRKITMSALPYERNLECLNEFLNVGSFAGYWNNNCPVFVSSEYEMVDGKAIVFKMAEAKKK